MFVLITTCFDPFWVIIRCISVYLEALFNMDPYFPFIFDYMIKCVLLSGEPLVCLQYKFGLSPTLGSAIYGSATQSHPETTPS
jgi:hypothetical protein